MKKLFAIIVLSALALTAFALTAFAQQKKVAVYVTGEQSDLTRILGDQLVSAFSQSGDFAAIERTTAFLSEISKEQKYQREGAVDDSEISRLGKQFGVNYVCVAQISELYGDTYISARLIDVESAEIVKSSNASGKMKAMSDLLAMSQSLVAGLVGFQYSATPQFDSSTQGEYGVQGALDRGFVQMDNLLVSVGGLMYSTYTGATKYAKKCTLGGFKDWRLPTKNELTKILKKSAEWHLQFMEFPDLTKQFKEDEAGKQNCRYWCQDKEFYENGTFGHGTISMPETMTRDASFGIRSCFVILVRDYK